MRRRVEDKYTLKIIILVACCTSSANHQSWRSFIKMYVCTMIYVLDAKTMSIFYIICGWFKILKIIIFSIFRIAYNIINCNSERRKINNYWRSSLQQHRRFLLFLLQPIATITTTHVRTHTHTHTCTRTHIRQYWIKSKKIANHFQYTTIYDISSREEESQLIHPKDIVLDVYLIHMEAWASETSTEDASYKNLTDCCCCC